MEASITSKICFNWAGYGDIGGVPNPFDSIMTYAKTFKSEMGNGTNGIKSGANNGLNIPSVKLSSKEVELKWLSDNYKAVEIQYLLGYRNIENKFIPGIIIDAAYEAMKNIDKPYFLCLDEMNLARVEYYFSEILSENYHNDFLKSQYLKTGGTERNSYSLGRSLLW